MYYQKKYYAKGLRRATVRVSDFSAGITTVKSSKLTPIERAYVCDNFAFKSGALTDGKGIRKAVLKEGVIPSLSTLGASPERIYYYKRYEEEVGLYVDYLLVYCSDGNIYSARLTDGDAFEAVSGLDFSDPPEALPYTYNGKDVIIFSSGSVMKVYDGIGVTAISDAPAITSMCMHGERLFATEGGQKTALWFSDDFDPLNWNVSLDEAGFIDLRDGRGSLLKAVSFGGYVYVFRGYGISRITAYGDQTGFSVDGITASSGRIFGSSITVCGDSVVYMAEDGFYRFSGDAPYRILRELDGLIAGVENDGARGLYYNGTFYCIINTKSGSTVQKRLLCYDPSSGRFSLGKNLYVKDMTLMEGERDFKLLFLCEGRELVGQLSEKSELFGAPLTKVWQSGESDLGRAGIKCLSSVGITTATAAKITVCSEYGKRALFFPGSDRECILPISLRGRRFKVEIESATPSSEITGLVLSYEYFGGG